MRITLHGADALRTPSLLLHLPEILLAKLSSSNDSGIHTLCRTQSDIRHWAAAISRPEKSSDSGFGTIPHSRHRHAGVFALRAGDRAERSDQLALQELRREKWRGVL